MLKYLVFMSLYFMVSNSPLEYGEFDLKVTKMEPCKGPKRKNCVEIVRKIENDTFVEMDYCVKEDMKTVKGKFIGFINDKPLLRLEMKNLCNHIFFRPMIQKLFNNTDHCAIEKGRYLLKLDIQTIARNFYGGKFMYGNWRFKWIFYNDFCNLECTEMYLSMTPKSLLVINK